MNLVKIIYLDVLILKWLEVSNCCTAFANFLSFDATTIAVFLEKQEKGKIKK